MKRLTKEREQEIRTDWLKPPPIAFGWDFERVIYELIYEIDALRVELKEEKLASSAALIGQEHVLGSRIEQLEKDVVHYKAMGEDSLQCKDCRLADELETPLEKE